MFRSRVLAHLALTIAALLFAPNTCAAETQTNPLRVQRAAFSSKSATRLSRPPLSGQQAMPCCEEGSKPEEQSGTGKQQISGFLSGVSSRWWRNFRNPTFCPFIICGGSCANMMGVPIVGAYTSSQLMSDETPCSIESVESSGGCCMGHGNSTAHKIEASAEKDIATNSSCALGEHNLNAGADCCSAK